MSAYLTFLFSAVLISLSGVMAPGPVTAVTLGKGNESPHAGVWIAVGHAVVEFPLIALLYFGFAKLLKLPMMEEAIAFVGGLFLLYMGYGLFKDIKNVDVKEKKDPRTPFVAGILLSAGNPYFLLWWATVGVALINKSIGFGFIGLIVFAFVHWLCDLAWLWFLSAVSWQGGKFFGKKFQEIVFGICSLVLFAFGGIFLYNAIHGIAYRL